jgi:hypothetical protein
MLTLFVTSFFKGLSWIDSRGGHCLLPKKLTERKRKTNARKKKSKKEDVRK